MWLFYYYMVKSLQKSTLLNSVEIRIATASVLSRVPRSKVAQIHLRTSETSGTRATVLTRLSYETKLSLYNLIWDQILAVVCEQCAACYQNTPLFV